MSDFMNNINKNHSSDAKKYLFVFAGLTIIVALFFFTKNQYAIAGKEHGKKFDDWSIVCEPKEAKTEEKRICYLSQQLNVENKEEGKTAVAALYQFVYVDVVTNPEEADVTKQKKETRLRLVESFPHNVALRNPGTLVIADKEIVNQGIFTHCNPFGCHALLEFNQEVLEKLYKGENNLVVYFNSDGQQINMPFSTKGLKAGLEYLSQ